MNLMLKGETSPLSSILPNVPRLLYFQSLTPWGRIDGILSLFLKTLPHERSRVVTLLFADVSPTALKLIYSCDVS